MAPAWSPGSRAPASILPPRNDYLPSHLRRRHQQVPGSRRRERASSLTVRCARGLPGARTAGSPRPTCTAQSGAERRAGALARQDGSTAAMPGRDQLHWCSRPVWRGKRPAALVLPLPGTLSRRDSRQILARSFLPDGHATARAPLWRARAAAGLVACTCCWVTAISAMGGQRPGVFLSRARMRCRRISNLTRCRAPQGAWRQRACSRRQTL